MLGALTITDSWLQTGIGISTTIVLAAVGYIAKQQRRSNDSLASTASSVERVAVLVEQIDKRVDRLERYQDTEHYADVIEHRQREGRHS